MGADDGGCWAQPRLLAGDLDPEKDAVKRRNIIERKQTADAQAEKHDGCHAVKQRITVDDQRRETQHGG